MSHQHNSFMELLKNGKIRFYILVLLCSVFFSIKIYRNSNPPVTGWDVFGYYVYLPQTFVYKDLKLQNTDHLLAIYKKYNLPGTLYQINTLDNSNHAMKYTSGWALLNLPFFLGGHIYAKANDYPVDGFSPPYQWSVIIACMFYLVLGMFLSAKLLLRYFSVTVSTWVFLLLIFGTNYYFIVTDAFTMPHLHLFTLYAAFLLVSDNWHQKRNFVNSFLLGGILALMALIRPTEIIAALIPLLWGVFSWSDFKNKFKLLFTAELKKSLVVIGAFVLVCLPQLLYWKTVSGRFLYYGYDNAGEGFEFLHPNLINVLFSFRKGWFIYTPLALFFIAGFFFLKKREYKYSLLIFYVLNVYIISCWTNWWYAESFSQRPLMHSFPVLLLPFGVLMEKIINERKYYFFAIFIPLTALNIFQTWQTNVGILHGSRMTFDYYKAIFLKTEIPAGAENLLLVDRSEMGENNFSRKEDYNRTATFTHDFENSSFDHISDSIAKSGTKACEVAPAYPFSYCFEKEFHEITEQDHAWIKVSMWVWLSDTCTVTLPTLVATFEHKGEPYTYRGLNFEADTTRTYPTREWTYVETYYLTPELRTKNDKFKAYLWLRGKGKAYVDDMKIEFYEHK